MTEDGRAVRGAGIMRHRTRRSARLPLTVGVAPGGRVVLGAAVLAAAVAATAVVGGAAPAARGPVWYAACGPSCPSAGQEPAAPRPTRIAIPRIGVDADLEVLGLDPSGVLRPPASFGAAGWFGQGPTPGDTGPAVIAGHVDSKTGPAVFHRLRELRAGDAVSVRRPDGWVRFRVVSVSRYAKDRFPTDAVYGPTPVPELRLVTCDGEFDRQTRHYRDNLVVFAVADNPAGAPTAAG